MTEFEWKKQVGRAEVAAVLRQIADGLEDAGGVELEQDSWELKLSVAEEVELEVELEIDEDESELEIQLTWATSGAHAGSREADAEAEEGAKAADGGS